MPIYIHTRKQLAAQVSASWYRTYREYIEGKYRDTPIIHNNKTKTQIYNELCELPPNPEPDVVDEIIGNKSWTRIRCNCCNKNVEEAVQVGEDRDYESNTAIICFSCLKDANEVARRHNVDNKITRSN